MKGWMVLNTGNLCIECVWEKYTLPNFPLYCQSAFIISYLAKYNDNELFKCLNHVYGKHQFLTGAQCLNDCSAVLPKNK